MSAIFRSCFKSSGAPASPSTNVASARASVGSTHVSSGSRQLRLFSWTSAWAFPGQLQRARIWLLLMCKRWMAVCRWLPSITTAAVMLPTSKSIVYTADCAPIVVRLRSNRALCPPPTSTNSHCLFNRHWPSMDDCGVLEGKCRLEVTLFRSVTAEGNLPSHGGQGSGDTGLANKISGHERAGFHTNSITEQKECSSCATQRYHHFPFSLARTHRPNRGAASDSRATGICHKHCGWATLWSMQWTRI